jgi:hypothetical protein
VTSALSRPRLGGVRWWPVVTCLGARAAEVLDDVGGVVADPADQGGAAGVPVLRAEEVRAQGAGDAAAVGRRAVGVQDGGVDQE